ncbi:MAG: PqiA/YebS family transporter subunit [Succinivibrionaceae bacterium]|nr:PqiA/YebS family transporter subunit [Succinivibrionaceae bacterium]
MSAQEGTGGQDRGRLEVCHHCDLVVLVPESQDHGKPCHCPRCGAVLVPARGASELNVGLMALSALLMLACALSNPFMSLSASGVSVRMSLFTVFTTLRLDWGLLLWVFLAVTLALPLVVLIVQLMVGLMGYVPSRGTALAYTWCHRYCMVDVFMMGVIISLVKLTSLADVGFHSGFFAALAFSLLVSWCWVAYRPSRLWDRLGTGSLAPGLVPGGRGMEQGVIVCRTCGAQYPSGQDGSGRCPRCQCRNSLRNPHALQKSLSLVIAASILYMPSNLYPVMFTVFLGKGSGANIIDGVVALWGMGSYFVAMVILFASICIPIFKILCIYYLVHCASSGKSRRSRLEQSRIYHVVELIGKWSMIDVFVVIIMSSVVRMGGLITINPGFAIVVFCSVVLLTLLSAEQFDERLIWDHGN